VRTIRLLMVVGSLALMVACGSSSGSGGSTISSVSVSCIPSTVQSGGTSQCSATVTGTGSFSSTVTWSANMGSTITTAGLLTVPTVSSTTTITVTATSAQDSSKSGMANVTVMSIVSNVQPIVVNAGPPGVGAVNEAFTSVTVCVPGTTQCQTIDNVLVDTGSYGLRLLSSASGGELTLTLPQEAGDSSGNPLAECQVFLDGYTWGTVATADITMAGEKAPAAPVQVIIPSTSAPAVPQSCSSQSPPGGAGNEGESLVALGANGILGVGLFQYDCGDACTTLNPNIPNVYYVCTSSGCNATHVTLAQQVTNPIILFASDNNGVLVELPSVPDGGSGTASGSMIFGIGTQSNNGLGSATVYLVPDSGNNIGDFITTFNGSTYPQSFIDSGSNGLFFPSSIPACSDNKSWYCPTMSPDNLTAMNQGQDASGTPVGTQGTVNFSIENADTLFRTNNTAFSTLGGGPGSATASFDWGLPFFFGRNVFTAIDNASTPGGPGPYYAY
jgi:Protein of unknown function (DUF3443)